jgi:hypothetical protein
MLQQKQVNAVHYCAYHMLILYLVDDFEKYITGWYPLITLIA